MSVESALSIVFLYFFHSTHTVPTQDVDRACGADALPAAGTNQLARAAWTLIAVCAACRRGRTSGRQPYC